MDFFLGVQLHFTINPYFLYIISSNIVSAFLCGIALEVWHGQLLSCFVLLVLTLDVLLYLLCIFPCRVHIVPTAPEFPVPVFLFLLRELLVQHQAAFSFHLPHETCYCPHTRFAGQKNNLYNGKG